MLAMVQTKDSRHDEFLLCKHKTEDCLVTGFVTTGGSEQSPPAQHSHYLDRAAFALLSERGEFIPSAAQKHTYFIGISLSGNIFSNHFPM